MKTKFIKSISASLPLLIALQFLNGCSSTPPPVAYVPPAPAEPAAPVFIGSGVSAGAASGIVHVEAIDYTNRTCLLGWPGGETILFKVGPEYVNFNRVKVGDTFMTTVSKNFVAYLVKSGLAPSSITNAVVTTKPQGSQPGAVMIRTVDYHDKVLAIDYATRRVVLQFGKDQAKQVQAGPGVNLLAVHVNDNVFIRTTEAIAIAVVPSGAQPAPPPAN
jgi:hypothetical protein